MWPIATSVGSNTDPWAPQGSSTPGRNLGESPKPPDRPGPRGNQEATMQPNRGLPGQDEPKAMPGRPSASQQHPSLQRPLLPQPLESDAAEVAEPGWELTLHGAGLACLPAGAQPQRQPSAGPAVQQLPGCGQAPGDRGQRDWARAATEAEGRGCPRRPGWRADVGAPAQEGGPGSEGRGVSGATVGSSQQAF